MDLRDPHLRPGRVWNIGCCDNNAFYRLGPNGKMQKKPPCADCESLDIFGIKGCDDCKYGEECSPECGDCQFVDMCDFYPDGDGDDFQDDDLPEVDYLALKEAQDALSHYIDEEIPLTKPLSFHLTEYTIKKIDNGYIITYHIGDDTRQRFVPDPKSIQGFIDQHTD